MLNILHALNVLHEGELALMYAKPRGATVKCLKGGILWSVDRTGFREAQKTSSIGTDVLKTLKQALCHSE